MANNFVTSLESGSFAVTNKSLYFAFDLRHNDLARLPASAFLGFNAGYIWLCVVQHFLCVPSHAFLGDRCANVPILCAHMLHTRTRTRMRTRTRTITLTRTLTRTLTHARARTRTRTRTRARARSLSDFYAL
jgi:hypothetical protein